MLIHEAVGEQLNCVFVDHGLLRTEAEQVIRVFRENYNIPLIDVNAGPISREIKWYYRPEEKGKSLEPPL